MIRFSVLSSGSRANCTYIEVNGCAFLIDCGLSCAQALARLRLIGIDPRTLRGVLITHEHRDHIHGVVTLSRKLQLPVLCSERIKSCLRGCHSLHPFRRGERFSLHGVEIDPVPTSHDADDPVGFVLAHGDERFGQFTDLGFVSAEVESAAKQLLALVLESNHDLELLRTCGYPWFLKQRIASDVGHLSNDAAAQLLGKLDYGMLQQIVLGHISENSNTPDCAKESAHRFVPLHFRERLTCASIHMSTPLFQIGRSADCVTL